MVKKNNGMTQATQEVQEELKALQEMKQELLTQQQDLLKQQELLRNQEQQLRQEPQQQESPHQHGIQNNSQEIKKGMLHGVTSYLTREIFGKFDDFFDNFFN